MKKQNVIVATLALAVMGLFLTACPGPPVVTATVTTPTVRVAAPTPTTEEWVNIPTMVHYDSGSSRLNDQGRAMLAEAHASMSHRTDIVRVRIDGHADDGAQADRNRLLADERANGVMDYLVGTLGMPRELFEVHSHGNSQPLTSGTTEADHAQNRRVQFSMLVRRQAAY